MPDNHTSRSERAVYLRALEPDDYRQISKWRHDEELYRLTSGNSYFVSSERDRQWVLEKIAGNPRELYLAICLRDQDRFIGYISLSDIDYRNSRAEWSGIVIGERDCHGKGYAAEAVFLLLRHAFDELGLHRISGTWLPDNKASLFLAKLLGFRQEGVLREYLYKGGQRHDIIIMSLLQSEFERTRQQYE